jgi:hypothetical protein
MYFHSPREHDHSRYGRSLASFGGVNMSRGVSNARVVDEGTNRLLGAFLDEQASDIAAVIEEGWR